MKEEIADTVIALINDTHNHLVAAIQKIVIRDPTWRDHISKTRLDTDELQRLGRPRVSKWEMVRYADRYGTDAAARRFNVTPGTLDKYRIQTQGKRRQK